MFHTQKAVKKPHLDKFTSAGYVVPYKYVKAGLFYVQKNGLTATASLGSTKIHVKATNAHAVKLMDEFEKLLDDLTRE